MSDERERIGSSLRARELGEALSKGRISYPSDDVVERYYSKYGSIEDEYLVDGAILTCSKATTETKYVLEQKFDCWESGDEAKKKRTRLKVFGHDISIVGAPLATVKAHEVEQEDDIGKKTEGNIKPFQCNCMEGPCNETEQKYLMKRATYFQQWGTCAAFMRLEDDWENEIRNTVYWQAPHTNPDSTKYMGGCPAQCVTMASVLFCSHGGFITPVTSGQGYTKKDVCKDIDKGIYSKDDFCYIATVAMGEANTLEGMVAVAYEILNRCNSQNISVMGVKDSGAYAGYENYEHEIPDDPMVIEAVAGALRGDIENPIGNAEFHFGRSNNNDLWCDASKCEMAIVIGEGRDRNVFYMPWGSVHTSQKLTEADRANAIIIYDCQKQQWNYGNMEVVINKNTSQK